MDLHKFSKRKKVQIRARLALRNFTKTSRKDPKYSWLTLSTKVPDLVQYEEEHLDGEGEEEEGGHHGRDVTDQLPVGGRQGQQAGTRHLQGTSR